MEEKYRRPFLFISPLFPTQTSGDDITNIYQRLSTFQNTTTA
jgi:hypothetical protein